MRELKNSLLSLLVVLVVTLAGCQVAENETVETSEADDQMTEDTSIDLSEFHFIRMNGQTNQIEDQISNYAYSFDLDEKTVIVRAAHSTIGLDGEEMEIPPQPFLDFEVADDGRVTFSYEQELYDETEDEIFTETQIVSLERLSTSVYESKDGIRYELTEEEREY